ncbi:MAG: hypothetical protein E7640_04330 [Ruminococcaceae bacterium]|nr:hypothetical protein [Oscillospiraceae bacterium]
MKTVFYNITSKKINRARRIVLISDVHDVELPTLAEDVAKLSPDIIAIPGDLTSRLDKLEGEFAETDGKTATHASATELLSQLSRIAPTYYSFGNHELCGHYYKKNFGLLPHRRNIELIEKTGARLLCDDFCRHDSEIAVGGLTSGMTKESLVPMTDWLGEFEKQNGFRILLCHHPEYYEKYLKDRDIDLVLSGHAHGGQVRIFGRGLFAPGQGILPRYDGGVFCGRLVVGRGLANTVSFPRLFNPRELVVIDIDRKVFL